MSDSNINSTPSPVYSNKLRLTDEDLSKLEIDLGKRSKLYRFWEIVPGFLSYLVVALPVIVGIWRADVAGFLILLFMLIWFFRTVIMASKALNTLAIIKSIKDVDWWKLLNEDYFSAREKLNEIEKKRRLSRLDKIRKNSFF